MATFIIDEKEYDLKIDFKAVKYLNGLYKGGSYELIGKAMMGDVETFPNIIYAALRHTGKNFSLKKVEDAIDVAIESEQLDFDGILRLSNEVITQSFFYKATVAKLMKDNPEGQKALENLTK